MLAHSFATLQEYSGGRAVIGIGVGDSSINNLGLKPARLKRFEQVIQGMRKLLAGETANFDGCDIEVSWPPCKVAVVMACTGPRSLQLGGRIGDGALFQVGADPRLVEYAKKNIAIGAKQANRDLSEIKLYQRLSFAVSGNREQVRKEARGYASIAANTIYRSIPKEEIPEALYADLERMVEQYNYLQHGSMDGDQAALLTDRILDALGIVGTPEEAVPRLKELMDLGVENFVFPIATKHPDAVIELIADKVMPHVS